MSTNYPYRLHVIVRSQQVAQQLSALVYQQFPEVGPDNVATQLVNATAADDATPVAWEFNAPVQQEYIDWLAALIVASPIPSNVLWWARTDRSDNLQKKNGVDESPRVFTVEDGRAECGLKLRVVPAEI